MAFHDAALVPGPFFPQIACQEVAQGDAASLPIVNEQALAVLRLDVQLDGDGFLFSFCGQALGRPPDLAHAHNERVIEA